MNYFNIKETGKEANRLSAHEKPRNFVQDMQKTMHRFLLDSYQKEKLNTEPTECSELAKKYQYREELLDQIEANQNRKKSQKIQMKRQLSELEKRILKEQQILKQKFMNDAKFDSPIKSSGKYKESIEENDILCLGKKNLAKDINEWEDGTKNTNPDDFNFETDKNNKDLASVFVNAAKIGLSSETKLPVTKSVGTDTRISEFTGSKEKLAENIKVREDSERKQLLTPPTRVSHNDLRISKDFEVIKALKCDDILSSIQNQMKQNVPFKLITFN